MLIQEYNSNWVSDFEKIKQKLETVLSQKTKVEHIGSTSVPHLAAKNIIDIDIVYLEKSEKVFEQIKKGLIKLGYYHNGNQGIEDREVFKRKDTTNEENILDKIPHHLYVCSFESEELKRHVLFRDFLRENEEARNEYQNLKYNLAQRVGQIKKQYAELKEKEAKSFIESIIRKAREK